jgi:hypothetical protein
MFPLIILSNKDTKKTPQENEISNTPITQLAMVYKKKRQLKRLYLDQWFRSLDSVVGIATGYGLDDRGIGVRVSVGSRIFSFPRHPDPFWGSPLLSNGCRWFFPRE